MSLALLLISLPLMKCLTLFQWTLEPLITFLHLHVGPDILCNGSSIVFCNGDIIANAHTSSDSRLYSRMVPGRTGAKFRAMDIGDGDFLIWHQEADFVGHSCARR